MSYSQEEHQQIRVRRGNNLDSEITWEDYKSMKFTSHVIHESLRLANIAPVLFRKAKQDVHIKGYTIPEGWTVMVCLSAVHLNPTAYEDPCVFNPWRWKVFGGSKDFIAFGSGLRFCVGADFAKLQTACGEETPRCHSSTFPPRRSFAGGSLELYAGELLHHVAIFSKQEASPSSSFLPIALFLKLKVKSKKASHLLVLHQPATFVGVVHNTGEPFSLSIHSPLL
nr:unnamed protein product [Digitaria exilis]